MWVCARACILGLGGETRFPFTSAMLHIRGEVFTFGVLKHDLLGLASADIATLVERFRAKDREQAGNCESDFPFLKYASWRAQSQQFFQCEEQLSKLYFETFLAVHNKNSTSRLSPGKLFLSVDFSEFMLFLFVQKYRPWLASESKKVGDKKKMDCPPQEAFIRRNILHVLGLCQDPWKHGAPGDSDPSSPGTIRSPRGLGGLFSENGSRSPSKSLLIPVVSFNPHELSLEAHEFDRLAFLLLWDPAKYAAKNMGGPGTSTSARDQCQSLSSLTGLWAEQPYCSVPITDLQEWVCANIVKTEYRGMDFPITHPFINSTRISNLNQITRCFGDESVSGGDLYISDCNDSSIYVTTHTRFAYVSNCVNCVINVGVVSGRVDVSHCQNLTLMAVSRSIYISNVDKGVVYMFCGSRPVLMGPVGALADVSIAPYNTYYPSLVSDIKAVKLSVTVNCWASPLVFSDQQSEALRLNQSLRKSWDERTLAPSSSRYPSKTGNSNSSPATLTASATVCLGGAGSPKSINAKSPTATGKKLKKKSPGSPNTHKNAMSPPRGLGEFQEIPVKLMSASDFFPHVFPFPTLPNQSPHETTKSNPFPLTVRFAEALQQRKIRAIATRAKIDRVELTEEQRATIQKLLERRFQTWLEHNSHNTYLASLSNPSN